MPQVGSVVTRFAGLAHAASRPSAAQRFEYERLPAFWGLLIEQCQGTKQAQLVRHSPALLHKSSLRRVTPNTGRGYATAAV